MFLLEILHYQIILLFFQFECCGTSGPNYWDGKVPESCKRDDKVFDEGCTKVFFDFLHNSVQVIGITLLALSATEVSDGLLPKK